jgi:hypothetical protein
MSTMDALFLRRAINTGRAGCSNATPTPIATPSELLLPGTLPVDNVLFGVIGRGVATARSGLTNKISTCTMRQIKWSSVINDYVPDTGNGVLPETKERNAASSSANPYSYMIRQRIHYHQSLVIAWRAAAYSSFLFNTRL